LHRCFHQIEPRYEDRMVLIATFTRYWLCVMNAVDVFTLED